MQFFSQGSGQQSQTDNTVSQVLIQVLRFWTSVFQFIQVLDKLTCILCFHIGYTCFSVQFFDSGQ
jgi:hypothetical protein